MPQLVFMEEGKSYSFTFWKRNVSWSLSFDIILLFSIFYYSNEKHPPLQLHKNVFSFCFFIRCFMGTCWNNFPSTSFTLSCPFSLVNCCSPFKFQFKVTSSGELSRIPRIILPGALLLCITVCNCVFFVFDSCFSPIRFHEGRDHL